MIIYHRDGSPYLEITVDDKSYRNRVIMGDHNLTLYYSLAEHIEIPVGSYCEFEGQRYVLMRPENLKMKHSRCFDYTVIMESVEAKSKIWKFRNTVDGRLKFSLTAKPKEHLQMFVDNMNIRDSGWAVGECIDGVETVINYDHVFCYEALSMMASEFKTEFEFCGKRVSLHKMEYNKNYPLPLSYGRGNGFKPNVGRSNYGDKQPVEILYTQGGTDNIDSSKYGSNELLLPKHQELSYDGECFEDEDGFNPDNARLYVTDALGYSIRRGDKVQSSLAEDSLDCTDIYPKRVGTIAKVETVDAEKHFYDIIDDSIPDSLNYNDYLIEGESMTIIFQSGMLASKEFDVKYIHEAKNGKSGRRFEIVPQDIDGQTMPNNNFSPQEGDSYAVFKVMLPDAYICDNATKTGASWDMYRAAVRYMFDNEDVKFTFTGELDGLWAKKDWMNIGSKIRLGGYIKFSDEHFQKDGVLVRITGVKDYINKPHSPVLTLSNSTVTCGFSTTLLELQSEEVLIEDYYNSAIQFTKRRFRDAKESMEMLENALLDNFTNSINPVAVQTMLMLVGDESLQFRFVTNTTNPSPVVHNVIYDRILKQLEVPAGIIQHMTLGIDTISTAHEVSEYMFWQIPAFTSPALTEADKRYYLYAKVLRDPLQTDIPNNSFVLSETAISMNSSPTHYHLLVGLLNSEYDGERSFVTLYGFTEILPGRITTDMIVSSDGKTYFDLVNSVIKGKINFIDGTSGYDNISDRPDLSHFVRNTDGIIELYYKDYFPSINKAPADSWTTSVLKEQHVGDLFRYFNGDDFEWYRWEKFSTIVDENDIQATVTDFRWTEVSPVPSWFNYISLAHKMFMGIPPTPPYSVNDIWLNGGVFLKCIRAKTSSENFNDADWDDAQIYDNTQTTIDGGMVTSGTVRLAGDNNNILAGITGKGKTSDSIRIWAGASFEQRANAPFRVLQDGSVVMNNAIVNGKIEADENSIFKGSVTIANGLIKLNSDGSGSFANNNIYWTKEGTIRVTNAIIDNATIYGKFTATQGLFLNQACILRAGTYHSAKTIDLNDYNTNLFYIEKNSDDNITDYSIKTTIILPSVNNVNILFIMIDPAISCDIGFNSYGQSDCCWRWIGNLNKKENIMLLRKSQSNSYNPWSIF